MLLNPFTFHAPDSLTEAAKLYASNTNAKLQAGGTFLINSLKMLKKKGARTPENILSLTHVDALKGICEENGDVIIKSMTTIDEILHSAALTGYRSVIKEAARNIATQPIRNMATLGGNLTCRYTWTEMPVVMVALGATMHFVDAKGQEEIVQAEDFFQAAAKTDKILAHVRIKKDKDAKSVYFRVKKSPYVDIPLLSLAVKSKLDHGRFTETIVAVNNGVAFAQRDFCLEKFLNQAKACEDTVEEALSHFKESIYETRSSDYKKHMFGVGIKKTLKNLMEKAK